MNSPQKLTKYKTFSSIFSVTQLIPYIHYSLSLNIMSTEQIEVAKTI